MKLDCEGAEFDILLSASDDSLSKINSIYAEIHQSDNIPYSSTDLVAKLAAAGSTYEMYDNHERDDVFTFMAIFRREPAVEDSDLAFPTSK